MGTRTHNERCRDCKANVRNLLAAVLGSVEVNYDLDLPSRLEDYKATPIYEVIGSVHAELEAYRGFSGFVKTKRLPRVDFFIPGRKLIIEFDESQHFTVPRDTALSCYPAENGYGFSVHRWRTLCQALDKKDNDPPYRDEQRAWYDTLRDFAPVLWETGRTIRLFARDLAWCSLDLNRENDLEAFTQLVTGIGRHDNDKT